ncbi:hypothetical protein DAI22_02g080600 [Oryza sativa Japonica Group]|nr:hypothetical protein DAI22_02g080600 [Oryza sativa Japonica Group]
MSNIKRTSKSSQTKGHYPKLRSHRGGQPASGGLTTAGGHRRGGRRRIASGGGNGERARARGGLAGPLSRRGEGNDGAGHRRRPTRGRGRNVAGGERFRARAEREILRTPTRFAPWRGAVVHFRSSVKWAE